MYTREDILALGEEYDKSSYGELRRKQKRQSFCSQLKEFLDESKDPDDALLAFLSVVYDRSFIEDHKEVFFGPFEDMPLYINNEGYKIAACWRFKIGH